MFDELNAKEKEFLAKELMRNSFGIFSPFELDENIDFPKKEELGGVVLKFIGGGAAYLKMQTEMPTEKEVESIHNVGKFLRDNFGEYVVICVLCAPDIEIHDINVDDFEMHVDFASVRKTNGDFILDMLSAKLEEGTEFTEEDHFYRLVLPFMGHDDDEEFQAKYSQFIDLFAKSNMELPDECKLNQYNIWDRLFKR